MVASYAENYPHIAVYMEDLGRIARQDTEWATDVIARTRWLADDISKTFTEIFLNGYGAKASGAGEAG
jgi:hypothetical protein